MRLPSNDKWRTESDNELLARHKAGNVIGISGDNYWQKMYELYMQLKKRNLI